ncbi:MAG: dTDP-4-dehydrorhamnose reductase [candidate division KSB1 bacterium]|nr:dTDP-4-dehydrorhamnose reductase [candidate division KSB1 bacterium]MDZ7335301.1 dTDP-4-dehydrorhamnose reductase [candidate division KSB1 bacterium]MDZ7357225.1 dTDP-4-dehydrorhamnose reductase [candidate division KSB1 bacterium]MDZ7375133.1 dTDP-4-dehydrorhamnose reductase [candidate division KSB1 bacterium]MDZ7399086.1 dTDP-4-dehydrorhamnose reductase [candidate division KSB1 bacterium]
MEKLVITGVNGLLGQKLLERSVSHYEVMGIDLHEAPFQTKVKFTYRQLDLTKRRLVKQALAEFQPHYLINTAAMTDVDGCETQKEQCWKINVEAMDHIIQAVRRLGTKIVHLSTDYVFDGKSGPYVETDTPEPLGYYGKSKLASENLLIASGLEHAIVRTMVLYGHGIQTRPNFVTWVIEKLNKGETVQVVTDQISNPTLADDLAEAILRIIERRKWDLFHICGSELIDRYHFALKIAEVFDLNQELIEPTTTAKLGQAATRPLKSGFIITKAQTELGIQMSDVTTGLKKLKKQLKRFLFF